jgi:hypothetical protein
LLAIVSPNLLKTSTNSPVISDLWGSVAEKLRLGLRIDAIRSHLASIGVAIAASGSDRGRRGWWCACPLGAANHGRHGHNRLGCANRIMLGMPLWSGAAHVVQLRPIGVEQSFGQGSEEVGDVGSEPGSLAGSSKHPNRGRYRDHDAARLACLPSRLLHSLVGHRAEHPGSMSDRSAALNLGKICAYALRNRSSFLRQRYVDRGAADVTGLTSLSLL